MASTDKKYPRRSFGDKPRAGSKGDSKPSRPPENPHGTRVLFRFTCNECGCEEELPYVPRSGGEYRCRACVRKELGEDWDASGRLAEPDAAFPFVCAVCGCDAELPRKPEHEIGLLCGKCFRGEFRSNPKRIGGEVLDRKSGVRRKRVVDPNE